MPHRQLNSAPLFEIQHITLHKALNEIEAELKVKHSLNAQLALQGIQAELSGNTQLAVATYAESHHPCAIARYYLLMQTYSPSLLQFNLQVTPSYHSRLSLFPSPLGSVFPGNPPAEIAATVSIKEEKFEKSEKSEKKKKSRHIKKYHQTELRIEAASSFTPMLQLAQTRAKNEKEQIQTAMPLSEDAKRIKITSLLN